MALVGKVEADVEVKVPADKLFRIIRSENHQIANASSGRVQSVEVHEGDWETHGSVKLWKYTCEGKQEILKEKVHYDDANKTATFVMLEGHVMDEFKSYKVVYKVTPKSDDQSHSVAKITIEYEKLNENIPYPTRYLQFLADMTKDIEAHLLKAK